MVESVPPGKRACFDENIARLVERMAAACPHGRGDRPPRMERVASGCAECDSDIADLAFPLVRGARLRRITKWHKSVGWSYGGYNVGLALGVWFPEWACSQLLAGADASLMTDALASCWIVRGLTSPDLALSAVSVTAAKLGLSVESLLPELTERVGRLSSWRIVRRLRHGINPRRTQGSYAVDSGPNGKLRLRYFVNPTYR
ncbi:MAG: hypothetical protein HMLKMBBP_00618 [Planctomycetes bacterium]|nr:hypothetical protein [Planctomycetota bacterium]